VQYLINHLQENGYADLLARDVKVTTR